MKKLISLLFIILSLSIIANSQTNTSFRFRQGPSVPISCAPADVFFQQSDSSFYGCTASNTFSKIVAGTVGSFTTLVASVSITDNGLTSGRVTFAGASGLLADDSDLTFSIDTLTSTKLKSASIIAPSDSTTAIRVFKADAATVVETFDTTNGGVGIGVTPNANTRLHLSGAAQWSSNNYGAQLVIDGGRHNAICLLDSASSNPWALVNVSNVIKFNTMPALGNTVTGAIDIFTIDSTGNTTQFGKVAKFNNVATVGYGHPTIYAAGRVTAQTAANASISTFTVGASDGSFEVSANMNVTASTALATTLTCTYTDESNTARTMIFPIQQLSGSFIAAGAITGVGAWETPVIHIRCKASTAITILTSAGTFTSVTYTAEGIIRQLL